MSYTVGNTRVDFGSDGLERQAATFLDGQGITDDAGFDAFVNGMSQAQINAAVKMLLKAMFKIGG